MPASTLIEAFKRPTQLTTSKAIAIELSPFRKPQAQIQISDNCYRFHNISTRITPVNLLSSQQARAYDKIYEMPEQHRSAWSWIPPTNKCYFKFRADVLPLAYSKSADEDLRNLRFNLAEQ